MVLQADLASADSYSCRCHCQVKVLSSIAIHVAPSWITMTVAEAVKLLRHIDAVIHA